MAYTVIQVQKTTVQRLKDRKLYQKQSYDHIINVLLDQTEEELTKEELKGIQKGLEDIKAGRVISLEDAARKLRVKL